MRVLPVRPRSNFAEEASPPSEIAAAAARLHEGGVVVFPTETFYALGADPRSAAGTALVFRLKRRPRGRPLPWVASSVEQVEAVCRLGPKGRELGDRYWPGPLTLILPRRDLPDRTAAVRVSSHPVARALAAALGHPVISTSANRSGRPPAVTVEAVAASLGPAADSVTALDGGPTPGGAPSVIVDVGGRRMRVLRGVIETLPSGFGKASPAGGG